MRVGGGLNYVTGPMGSGKTLFGTRRIVSAVTSGQYVVTNVRLGVWRDGQFHPGDEWADRVARHYWWHRSREVRRRIADRLRGYYIYEESLREAMRYRLPGTGESRGVFVWDESHNDLNNRDWRSEGRDSILRWATQLRKLGYVGYLLSQHADNTDAALRRVCNFIIRIQNQREHHRVLGLRLTPWPLFLAYWYPSHLGAGGIRVLPYRIDRYFLSWHRRLYDTWGVYHGLDDAVADEDMPILLPPGGRSRPASGGRLVTGRTSGHRLPVVNR